MIKQYHPVVSILMTAYNREKFIGDAIKSVLNSTYQQWELIIVDDVSSDSTVEIARKYEKRDGRIKVYVNEKNLGDYPNRNRAASFANGEYLKYLDADDLIYPHGLEIFVNSINEFPLAGIAISQNQTNKYPYPKLLSPRESYLDHFIFSGLFNCSPLSTIVRKNAFFQVGGFSGKRYIGDLELWLKVAAIFNVVKILPGLAWWRGHDIQESLHGNFNYDYPVLRYLISKESLLSPNCPLLQPEKNTILKNLKKIYFKNAFKAFFSGRFLKFLDAIIRYNYGE